MKEAKFTVPGEPKGKGRPRFSVRTGKGGKQFASARTPEDTVIYENLIRLEYERQCRGVFFPKDTPVEMDIKAYYSIPKSASKKKAKLMAEGKLRPLKKPDADNLIKVLADAGNRVAYYDDTQIADIHMSKYYGEVPRVEVTLRESSEEKGEEDAQ